jgi:hypothetical protein
VIPFACQTLFQTLSFHTGAKSGEYEDINDNHVFVSHKLCGFQGHVCRCVVTMKEPIVVVVVVAVVPKFQSFS